MPQLREAISIKVAATDCLVLLKEDEIFPMEFIKPDASVKRIFSAIATL